MTNKTKKALNNALASARMEGFDFTDEQIDMLTKLIERVGKSEITWSEAIEYLTERYKVSKWTLTKLSLSHQKKRKDK